MGRRGQKGKMCDLVCPAELPSFLCLGGGHSLSLYPLWQEYSLTWRSDGKALLTMALTWNGQSPSGLGDIGRVSSGPERLPHSIGSKPGRVTELKRCC